MRDIADLTREELERVVRSIQTVLYGTEYLDAKNRPRLKLDRSKVWDADTMVGVDDALIAVDLAPEDNEDA